MVRRLEDKGSRHQDGWKIAPRPSVSSHSHYVVHSENLPGFEDFPSGSAVNALRASDEVALQTPTSLTGESNVININLISDKFFYVFLLISFKKCSNISSFSCLWSRSGLAFGAAAAFLLLWHFYCAFMHNQISGDLKWHEVTADSWHPQDLPNHRILSKCCSQVSWPTAAAACPFGSFMASISILRDLTRQDGHRHRSQMSTHE